MFRGLGFGLQGSGIFGGSGFRVWETGGRLKRPKSRTSGRVGDIQIAKAVKLWGLAKRLLRVGASQGAGLRASEEYPYLLQSNWTTHKHIISSSSRIDAKVHMCNNGNVFASSV